jgi:hypothetical protein
MAKFIKNIDETAHTYQGQEIQPDEHYELQVSEYSRWANDSYLLSDIAQDKAKVGSSSSDWIDSYNDQINFLKDNIPKVVQTQFERDDLILKIAKAKADVDVDGLAVVEIKIPGVMADDGCRWIDGGKAFFDVGHAGDCVTEIAIVDKDDVLGYGANTVLKTYHDEECDAINQGWYIYPTRPLEIETLGYYGKIPSELYLIIKAKKATGHESGTFFVSLDWGVIG